MARAADHFKAPLDSEGGVSARTDHGLSGLYEACWSSLNKNSQTEDSTQLW